MYFVRFYSLFSRLFVVLALILFVMVRVVVDWYVSVSFMMFLV